MKTPLEFLDFLLYPWKFQTKQGLTPAKKLHKIVLHPLEPILVHVNKVLENPLAISFQYPWKFHILNSILFSIAS